MSSRFNFSVVVILAGILLCAADSGCPNEPVTPLPTLKTSTESPNEPVTALPIQKPSTECPNAPVTPIPTPKPSAECPNAPVTPLPTPKPSTECPNAPVTPSSTKAPVEPVTSTTTVTPPTSGREPPAGSLSINETNSVQCSSCVNRPGYACIIPSAFMASQCCLCCTGCCSVGTETTATPPTTTVSPPEALIKCPPGTVLLGRRCHLLYCPRGSQMINDRCIVTVCPEGTIWSGYSCTVPEPIVQNLNFQSTIVTQLNQTRPEIVLNNTNNIFVNASLSLQFDTEHENDCNDENSDCGAITPAQGSRCCDVMTPRICKQHNNRWRCYSRRTRKCGEFCVAPIIYLRPPGIQATPNYLVMPPMQSDCLRYGNCDQKIGEYDCSGCASIHMERCSSYCYRYVCPPRRCGYYDQEKYCTNNAGFYGCTEEDGWLLE